MAKFKTWDEVNAAAKANNLQSVTAEYGDVKNQEAIDAAKKYNTDEQGRVLENSYRHDSVEEARRLNALRGSERADVIDMNRRLQNSIGGTTDTGFTKSKITSSYVPKEYEIKQPGFQAVPAPAYSKTTISRFNPNAGGPGGARQRPGVYQFLNPDGSLASRYSRQRIGSFVAKVNQHKFNHYDAMTSAVGSGSNYALVNKPDMLADKFNVWDAQGNNIGQEDFLTAAVSRSSALLKYAYNNDWKNRANTAGLSPEEITSFNYYKNLKLGTPDALIGTEQYTDSITGKTNTQEVLGNGFQIKFGEGENTTPYTDPITGKTANEKLVINTPTTFKVIQLPNTTGTLASDFKFEYEVNPAYQKLVEAKASDYLTKLKKDPDAYKKYMADLDAHNDTLDKSQQVSLEDAMEHFANIELTEQYMISKPPYLEEVVLANIINGVHKNNPHFKIGEKYGVAPAEVYAHSGILQNTKGLSSNVTSAYPSGVNTRYHSNSQTRHGGIGSSPYTVASKIVKQL